MGAHAGEGADIVFRCIGDDLAGLAAGVGGAVNWERLGWNVWESPNDRLVARRDTES